MCDQVRKSLHPDSLPQYSEEKALSASEFTRCFYESKHTCIRLQLSKDMI